MVVIKIYAVQANYFIIISFMMQRIYNIINYLVHAFLFYLYSTDLFRNMHYRFYYFVINMKQHSIRFNTFSGGYNLIIRCNSIQINADETIEFLIFLKLIDFLKCISLEIKTFSNNIVFHENMLKYINWASGPVHYCINKLSAIYI
jgi:hypothetical protein